MRKLTAYTALLFGFLVAFTLPNRTFGQGDPYSTVSASFDDNDLSTSPPNQVTYALPNTMASASCVNHEVGTNKVSLELDWGDQYKLGNQTISASLDATIVARDGSSNVLKTFNVSLVISSTVPKQVFEFTFSKETDPAIYQSIEEYELTVSNYGTTCGAHNACQFIDLDFVAEREYITDGGSTNHVSANVASTMVTNNGVANLIWYQPTICIPFKNYEFQLLKLENSNASKTDPDDIEAHVDWSKALTLETYSSLSQLTLTLGEGYGFYAWRVRPIGDLHEGGINNPDNHGVWSGPSYSTTNLEPFEDQSLVAGQIYYTHPSTPGLGDNSIYQRTFAEGDLEQDEQLKFSEGISYADGLNQVRQTQSRLQSNSHSLIEQTVYDNIGRPVIKTLPVPVSRTDMSYEPDFFMESTGTNQYGPDQFDDDSYTDFPKAKEGVFTNVTDYYTDVHTDVRIPSSKSSSDHIPFTQTFHNPGYADRPIVQGGVGETFRVKEHNGSDDYSVKTYYAPIAEKELTRVFGSESPKFSTVHKVIIVDPNQVASVQYVDENKKILATCLLRNGQNMDDGTGTMEGLTGKSTAGFTVEYGDFPVADPEIKKSWGQYGWERTISVPIFEPKPLTWKYELDKKTVQALCDQTQVICKTCDYYVEVKIFNDSDPRQPMVLLNTFTHDLPPIDCASNTPYSTNFTTGTLNPGRYIFIQKIKSYNKTSPTSNEFFYEQHLDDIRTSYETTINSSIQAAKGYLTQSPPDLAGFYGKYLDACTGVDINTYENNYTDNWALGQTATLDFGCGNIQLPVRGCESYPCPATEVDLHEFYINSLVDQGLITLDPVTGEPPSGMTMPYYYSSSTTLFEEFYNSTYTHNTPAIGTPGILNDLLTNIGPGSTARCQDIWQCWDAAVSAISDMNDMYNGTGYTYNFFDQFVSCVRSKTTNPSYYASNSNTTSLPVKGYSDYAHEAIHYDPGNTNHVNCFTTIRDKYSAGSAGDPNTASSHANWTNVQWEELASCLKAVNGPAPNVQQPVTTTLSATNTRQQVIDDCLDKCLQNEPMYRQQLIERYHETGAMVEGDKYMLKQLSTGEYVIDYDTPANGFFQIGKELIDCQVRGLVKHCNDMCDIDVITTPGGGQALGPQSKIDKLTKVFGYVFDVQLQEADPDPPHNMICIDPTYEEVPGSKITLGQEPDRHDFAQWNNYVLDQFAEWIWTGSAQINFVERYDATQDEYFYIFRHPNPFFQLNDNCDELYILKIERASNTEINNAALITDWENDADIIDPDDGQTVYDCGFDPNDETKGLKAEFVQSLPEAEMLYFGIGLFEVIGPGMYSNGGVTIRDPYDNKYVTSISTILSIASERRISMSIEIDNNTAENFTAMKLPNGNGGFKYEFTNYGEFEIIDWDFTTFPGTACPPGTNCLEYFTYTENMVNAASFDVPKSTFHEFEQSILNQSIQRNIAYGCTSEKDDCAKVCIKYYELNYGDVGTPPLPPTCEEIVAKDMINMIDEAVEEYIQGQLDQFEDDYEATCSNPLNIDDKFWVEADLGYYHYTLYYYDRLGRLIKTVPPEGVDEKSAPSRTNEPTHRLETTYEYNSLGQLVEQHTPDAGRTRFYYDNRGQLRFSQNEQQMDDLTYAFTKYDDLGRIIEVGLATLGSTILNDPAYANDPKHPRVNTSEETWSTYSGTGYNFHGRPQRNTLNRISFTKNADGAHTIYSYDPHGNVEWLIRHIPHLGDRYIEYKYDLLSSNVKEVIINMGEPDEFRHRYFYDADNRITSVQTSRDGVIWDKDGTYEYYDHGPLSRAEIGHDQIQGLDYIYTINGWLKGINHPALDAANDPGQDGAAGSDFPKDAYGMQLSYFDGDFNRTGSPYNSTGTAMLNAPNTADGSFDLYNGNISASSWQTDESLLSTAPSVTGIMGFEYRYDELNRIHSTQKRDFDTQTQDWNSTLTNRFKTEFEYDGNGNIEELRRYGDNSINNYLMDHFTYEMDNGNPSITTNRLTKVMESAPDQSGYTLDIDRGVGPTKDYAFDYDLVGNLKEDVDNGIASIEWTMGGKIRSVNRVLPTSDKNLKFYYDASGHRIIKEIIEAATGVVEARYYYLRDPQGNVMAMYKGTLVPSSGNYVETIDVIERPIYGTSRLGIFEQPEQVKVLTHTPTSTYDNTPVRISEVDHFWMADGHDFSLMNPPASAIPGSFSEVDFSNSASTTSLLHGYFNRPGNNLTVVENQGGQIEFVALVAEDFNGAGYSTSGQQGKLVVLDPVSGNYFLPSTTAIGNATVGLNPEGRIASFRKPNSSNEYILFTVGNQTLHSFVVNVQTQQITQHNTHLTNYQFTMGLAGIDDDGVAGSRLYMIGALASAPVNTGLYVYSMAVTAAYPALGSTPDNEFPALSIKAHLNTKNEIQVAPNGAILAFSYPYYNFGFNGNVIVAIGLNAQHRFSGKQYRGYPSPQVYWSKPQTYVQDYSFDFSPTSQYIWTHGKQFTDLTANPNALYRADLIQHDLFGNQSYFYDFPTVFASNVASTSGPNLTQANLQVRRGKDGKLYFADEHKTPYHLHNGTSWITIYPNTFTPYTNYTAHNPLEHVHTLLNPDMVPGTGTTPVQGASILHTPAVDGHRSVGGLTYQTHRIYAPSTTVFSRLVDEKQYELQDQLGNVHATASDRKDPINFADLSQGYTASLLSMSDYYPFGSLIESRISNTGAGEYTYGFNGKERDDEILGSGNNLNFGARIYDPRLGKWLSVDPLASKYVDWSPYNYGMDNPLYFVDPDGKEVVTGTIAGMVLVTLLAAGAIIAYTHDNPMPTPQIHFDNEKLNFLALVVTEYTYWFMREIADPNWHERKQQERIDRKVREGMDAFKRGMQEMGQPGHNGPNWLVPLLGTLTMTVQGLKAGWDKLHEDEIRISNELGNLTDDVEAYTKTKEFRELSDSERVDYLYKNKVKEENLKVELKLTQEMKKEVLKMADEMKKKETTIKEADN